MNRFTITLTLETLLDLESAEEWAVAVIENARQHLHAQGGEHVELVAVAAEWSPGPALYRAGCSTPPPFICPGGFVARPPAVARRRLE